MYFFVTNIRSCFIMRMIVVIICKKHKIDFIPQKMLQKLIFNIFNCITNTAPFYSAPFLFLF